MKTPFLLMLIASVILSVICLGLLAAYLFTGSRKTILLRLAGASGLLASLFWIIRTIMERR
jgi:hypothetical protein